MHMTADQLNLFYEAAVEIIVGETHSPVSRSGLEIDQSDHVTDEFTVYVGLVGAARGMIIIGMSIKAARYMAGNMIGDPQSELTEMGISALAELGNLTAAKACIHLDRLGYPCDITPPTIMMGGRARVSTLGLPRFVIPLATIYGLVNVHVAVSTAT